jgi:thymidine phosphorylase
MGKILEDVGCCIVGQTATLVPGDRILYSIRDITGTVNSIPLISSSIVSKKVFVSDFQRNSAHNEFVVIQVAEGLSSLVLDVKVGRAAFMKTYESAKALAISMVAAASGNGVKTVAVLTDMDAPIGRLIGNSLEIIETIETLKGNGPADLLELTCELGGQLLVSNGNAANIEQGREMINKTFNDGTALAQFRQMMIAQGVDEQTASKVCDYPWKALPIGAKQTPILASKSGFVSEINGYDIAVVAGQLGAGRATAADKLDFGVGVQLRVQIGEAVVANEPLFDVYHNKDISEAQLETLKNTYVIVDSKPAAKSRVLEVIRP